MRVKDGKGTALQNYRRIFSSSWGLIFAMLDPHMHPHTHAGAQGTYFQQGFKGFVFIFGLWQVCCNFRSDNNPQGECITAHGWRKWCGGGVMEITLEWFYVVTGRDDKTFDRGRHSTFYRSWNILIIPWNWNKAKIWYLGHSSIPSITMSQVTSHPQIHKNEMLNVWQTCVLMLAKLLW